MLRLDQTALLLSALRPPSGMVIDTAIGTTFTLDLAALLTIPVAATFDASVDTSEPVDVLETIRHYANRTVLFCQAGAISVPSRFRPAHTLVEQTVVEVRKPKGGLFHPKLWVVRFSDGDRFVHRVLVMSRNLTFDRAWDVLVRLDEAPGAEADVELDGLLALLRALPTMAVRELTDAQQRAVSSVLATLEGARLTVPEPFETAKFVALMDGHRGWPFKRRHEAALAVSPFLTSGAVTRFFKSAAKRKAIVSRQSAIDAQASALATVGEIYRMKDILLSAEDDYESLSSADEDDDHGVMASPALKGLHAKIYIQDHGTRATAWLGSANLTDGAFRTNVDVLLELSGPQPLVGVESTLSKKGRKDDLSWVVEPHDPAEAALDIDPEEGVGPMEAYAYDLASRSFRIACTFDEGAGEDGKWTAELIVAGLDSVAGITVQVRLLSLPRGRTVQLDRGRATWSSLTAEELTPFVVVSVASEGTTRNMLVRADIEGDPDDRRVSVLARAIRSREDFMRYLAALLGVDLGDGLSGGGGGGLYDSWIPGLRVDRVLEDLLTTASRSPSRLGSLEHTLAALQRDDRIADIVPPDFADLWAAVYSSRKSVIG